MLTIAPWTQFWERNYFALLWPWLGTLMSSPYVRGGVTGVGLITILAGLRDLGSRMIARTTPPTISSPPSADPGPPQP